LEDEHGAIPVVWNLGLAPRGGTLPTADIKGKLRKLTTVNYNCRNWSWLLDPNRFSVPPIIPRVPPSSKSQLAPKLEEPAREESHPASEPGEPAREESQSVIDLDKSRVSGRMVPSKKKTALAQLRVFRALG